MATVYAPVEELAEPIWDIAHLFPAQGFMDEAEYLALDTNHLVEFSHGRLEVLSMPTQSHQLIAIFLYNLLSKFVDAAELGLALLAPMRIRLWPGKIREPDVLFMRADHAVRRGEQYWQGADLVMEVVSPDDRRRDLDIKRREYAQAGIPEYWIVDPADEVIIVLTLGGEIYREHGRFGPGETATSVLLEGFSAEVSSVFAAANR